MTGLLCSFYECQEPFRVDEECPYSVSMEAIFCENDNNKPDLSLHHHKPQY